MDLNTLYLKALIQQAQKLPEEALPHLGTLAHLGLWLSGDSRRRFFRGIAGIFGNGAPDHKNGIEQLLRIRELDHEMRAGAAREANRLRRKVADPFDRAAIRKFFWALRQATIMRSYYQLLLDPTEAEGEQIVETIFDGTAFREGGLASKLIEKTDSTPSPTIPPFWLLVDPVNYRAVLDGQPYPLTSWEQGLLLRMLVDAEGAWVTSGDVSRAYPDLQGARFDRQVQRLPAPIRALIVAKPGAGYMLHRP